MGTFDGEPKRGDWDWRTIGFAKMRVGTINRLAIIEADYGYRGKLVPWVKALRPYGKLHLEIIRSHAPKMGFVVQPYRWLLERSFARLIKCRRLVKDYERKIPHSAGFIRLAFIRLMSLFVTS